MKSIAGKGRATGLAFVVLKLTFLTLSVPWQAAAVVGSWAPLANLAPAGIGHLMLLSDGTVMAQQSDYSLPGPAGTAATTNWYRLTPGTDGGYTDGRWSTLAPSHRSRVFYQSFVIPDGRVVFVAGEYGTGHNDVEVFDPIATPANAWTLPLLSPAPDVLDASSELLPDGNLLVSPWYCNLTPPFVTLIYNPMTNGWSFGPSSLGSQNEATWIKLPDDSILSIDRCTIKGACDSSDQSPFTGYTNTERFIPSLNRWIADAPLPPGLLLWSNVEIGAALLLPNGKAFFIGGSGQTGIYTPSGTTNSGTWAPGRSVPLGLVNQDGPAAMLVNGKILCVVHDPGQANNPPKSIYEYDYLSNSFASVSSPTASWTTAGSGANRVALLALPDGNVLLSDTTSQLYVYTPNPTPPVAAGKPSILSVIANGDGSYSLTGTGLNGISAGADFGDDAQMNSNYPLVRLTDGSGDVFYARTYNWSSTGVRTGSRVVSTQFTVPNTVGDGTYSLVVVANGISSDPVSFSGPVWVDFNYLDSSHLGTYDFPYNTMTTGVSAVPTGGMIKIKTAGSTAETMTISKTMTIVAVGGPATIGK
jgi:hypothetical protein